MKNFNINIFLAVTFTVVLLLIPSFFAALAQDEGTLRPDHTFLNFFVRVFYIIRFPTHTLFWPIITAGGLVTFFGGLLINCMFYGLVVERIASLFKKKSKLR